MALAEALTKLENAVEEVNSKRAELDKLQSQKEFELAKVQKQMDDINKSYGAQISKASDEYTVVYNKAQIIRDETMKMMNSLLPGLGQSRVRTG